MILPGAAVARSVIRHLVTLVTLVALLVITILWPRDAAAAPLPAGARASLLSGRRGGAHPEYVIASDSAGTVPNAVAIDDVNRDGIRDLVIANGGSSSVSVLLGTGAGSFGPPVELPVGGPSYTLALDDVNGDGNPDLVVGNDSTASISVLLGDGRGSFGPRIDHAVGVGPRALALFDLDGNGTLDAVVANLNSNSLSVMSGDGAGGFTNRTDFATGVTPYGLAIGDLNGDGAPDVVTANYMAGTVSVRLGDGAGGFGARSDVPVGVGPYAVAIARLDGDAARDLAVTNAGSGTVSLLFGDGQGGVARRSDVAVAGGPRLLVAADLNGDGSTDLATANANPDGLTLLYADSSGGFRRLDIPTGASRGIAVADLDADGHPDIVVTHPGSNTVSVVRPWLPAPSRTRLTSSPNPSLGGLLITFVASVSAPGGSSVAGEVTFTSEGSELGRAPVSTVGTAVLVDGEFLPGTHPVVARYGGNDGAFPSVSDTLLQRVHAATTTVIAADSNVVEEADTVTIAATVQFDGTRPPGGSMLFHDGDSVLGAAPVVNATARLVVGTLVVGTHQLTATYLGDSIFVGSTSRPYRLVVVPSPAAPAPPTVELVTPNPITGSSINVRFGLPDDAPAVLELLDLAGRRIAAQRLDQPGAGWHVARLGEGLRGGVYLVRLRQHSTVRVTRVVTLR